MSLIQTEIYFYFQTSRSIHSEGFPMAIGDNYINDDESTFHCVPYPKHCFLFIYVD